jgi:hypothetical protein
MITWSILTASSNRFDQCDRRSAPGCRNGSADDHCARRRTAWQSRLHIRTSREWIITAIESALALQPDGVIAAGVFTSHDGERYTILDRFTRRV